uniref:Protein DETOXIFICATION n=1 Tax=Oryza rufipogon TaxID=4529 RepID=A0A0E0QSK3_ORYRU
MASVPLLAEWPAGKEKEEGRVRRRLPALAREAWEESKKLWEIVGPAVFLRLVLYSFNIISQAFAGHIGDLELAAFSIANNVITGLNFGFLLGMASALETLCGQAYGAKQYSMLGIYLQRSWIILFVFAVLLVPTYVFTAPLLEALGQPAALARKAGMVSVYMLPSHFQYAVLLPLNKFLQSQRKNWVTVVTAAAAFPVHIAVSWLLVSRLRFGVLGAAMSLGVSGWLVTLLQLAYVVGGGCPVTWSGFSPLAFVDLWGFIKLSVSSGVMVCLETWYYKILILLTGHLKNSELAVNALSICMSFQSWEMMIPVGFLAGTGVRVANELGAGNGKGAKFATIVSTTTSFLIGLFFSALALAFHDKIALVFSSSNAVIDAVDNISFLLAVTILLNGVQPVLSGVAIGSGWQAAVAYVNIGCYYFIGVPIGVLLGWSFNLGVLGIWAGMIAGTAIQTIILAHMTIQCDWNKEVLQASERVQRWGNPK